MKLRKQQIFYNCINYGLSFLGNENIHMISINGHHELSIYMQAGSEHRTANYSTFSVGDERSIYRLTVTGYSGNSGGRVLIRIIVQKFNNLNFHLPVFVSRTGRIKIILVSCIKLLL